MEALRWLFRCLRANEQAKRVSKEGELVWVSGLVQGVVAERRTSNAL